MEWIKVYQDDWELNKVIQIITLPILQTSKEFELVLDPFMGSGTTGRVCDQLGRRFVGYDLKCFC